jgi:hypothetical protein
LGDKEFASDGRRRTTRRTDADTATDGETTTDGETARRRDGGGRRDDETATDVVHNSVKN